MKRIQCDQAQQLWAVGVSMGWILLSNFCFRQFALKVYEEAYMAVLTEPQ